MSDSEGESSRKSEKYFTGGAKGSLHGYDYQLKLLMLFALNGSNCGIKFNLAAENVDSEWDIFDDLVFRYVKGNGKIKYRFLQVKYCKAGDKKIKIIDLLSESDSDNYSLQNFFKSYLIYGQQYQDGYLKDLIICTNGCFDFEIIGNKNKQIWKGYFEEKLETGPILKLGGKIYKFKKSKKTEIIDELKPIFEKALLAKPQKENTKEPKNNKFLDYLSGIAGYQLSLDDCIDKLGDFLDRLVFAVEQPSRGDLEAKLHKNHCDLFNLINNNTYSEFYKFMQDHKNKIKEEKDKRNMEADYLRDDDLKRFINEAKQAITKLGMISSNLFYKAKMKDCSIKFKDEIKEFQEIMNFLNDNDKQILIMYHRKALLSGIKICQILEKYSYGSDDYMFSDLKSLSILKRNEFNPTEAFKSSARNLVIVEYDSKGSGNVLKPFIEVLRDKPKKKFILFASKEQKNSIKKVVDQLFDDKNRKYTEFEDNSNKFTDLTYECQKCLEKEGAAIFQGKEITLSSVIDENKKYLISGEVLRVLINNKKIEIGNEIEDLKYNKIKEYYIERIISRTIKISQVIEKQTSKFFIINDNKKPVSIREDKRDILLISDNDDLFMKLCNEHINKNIHLLRKEGNEFVWQQSRGDLLQLRTFIVEDSQNVTLFKPDSINDKEVIIVSEPGMGKSMLLTHIALQNKETDPSLLVLKINLVDYSSESNKLKAGNNNEAFVKFLYKTFLKKCTKLTETFLNSLTITIEDHKICIKDNDSEIDDVSWLEVQLFNEFYNNGKVIFFFDGFDEICPDYEVEVTKLLKVLKRSRSKIWITTRPYDIYKELEKKLGVFSYCLERFSQDEQQNYLKKFWSVDDERSDIFVKGLLKDFSKFTEDIERNFVSIPLLLNMLAVVFKKEFKYWYDSGTVQFSISDGNKKLLNNLNSFYEEFFEMPLKKYKKLAAYSFLDLTLIDQLLIDLELEDMDKKINNIKDGKEKTDLISHVSDGKPVFVHRTFGEYFLSRFIFDKLKAGFDANEKIWDFLIKQIFVQYKHRFIRHILNCLFVDYEVDYNKSEIIKKLLKDTLSDFLTDLPSITYTPLHVASKEGLVEIVKFILKNLPTDELKNVPDKYFNNDLKLDINNGSGNENIMEKKFINVRCCDKNALEYAVMFQHDEIVRLLLNNDACITKNSIVLATSDKYFNELVFNVFLDFINSDKVRESIIGTILCCNYKNMYFDNEISIVCLKMLIKKLDNNVNIQNEDRNTLLQIVARLGKKKK